MSGESDVPNEKEKAPQSIKIVEEEQKKGVKRKSSGFQKGSFLNELDKEFDDREAMKEAASSNITKIIVGEKRGEREEQLEREKATALHVKCFVK